MIFLAGIAFTIAGILMRSYDATMKVGEVLTRWLGIFLANSLAVWAIGASVSGPAPAHADYVVGSSSQAVTAPTPPCAPKDGSAVRLFYGVPVDRQGPTLREARPTLRSMALQADARLYRSGGEQHFRWICNRHERVKITKLSIPGIGDGEFTYDDAVAAMRAAGHDDPTNRIYLLFYGGDSYAYCGQGSVGGQGNRTQYAVVARAEGQCWTAGVTLHELGHTLGAVLDASPHSDGKGHCTQGKDVMCSDETVDCPDVSAWRFDCKNDDYYMHDGRWWDTADSVYLTH